MIISWNTVIFKFRSDFLGRMSKEFCRDRQSICRPVEANCSVFLLLPRINGLSTKTPYGRSVPPQFTDWCVAKIQRNLKMTVFQEWSIDQNYSTKLTDQGIILFCGRMPPSNDVKINNTFSSQCTENPPVPLFLGTPGIVTATTLWPNSLVNNRSPPGRDIIFSHRSSGPPVDFTHQTVNYFIIWVSPLTE